MNDAEFWVLIGCGIVIALFMWFGPRSGSGSSGDAGAGWGDGGDGGGDGGD